MKRFRDWLPVIAECVAFLILLSDSLRSSRGDRWDASQAAIIAAFCLSIGGLFLPTSRPRLKYAAVALFILLMLIMLIVPALAPARSYVDSGHCAEASV